MKRYRGSHAKLGLFANQSHPGQAVSSLLPLNAGQSGVSLRPPNVY